MTISIIIPTQNEEAHIKTLLNSLNNLGAFFEIIVVDGHSTDQTAALAGKFAKVIFSDLGRGRQMNVGAKEASGEVLWFIHADCLPHQQSVPAIKNILSDPEVVGGGFEYNLTAPGWMLRLSEFLSNRKNHLLQLIYGDMGIFVRREIFEKIGGYKEIPLMEDMEFCKDLKKEGKIVILPQRIDTSARRWLEEGIYKNMVRNWLLQIVWKLGAKPEFLAKFYPFGNKKKYLNKNQI